MDEMLFWPHWRHIAQKNAHRALHQVAIQPLQSLLVAAGCRCETSDSGTLMAGNSKRAILGVVGKAGLQLSGLVAVTTVVWTGIAYGMLEAHKGGYLDGVPRPSDMMQAVVAKTKEFHDAKEQEQLEREERARQAEEDRLMSTSAPRSQPRPPPSQALPPSDRA